ncbi:MAG: DUF4149 domain-containing protein [Nitrospinales bacterium]
MVAIQFIYILSLVVWIGGIVFFSFFTAPAVFKTLDRQKAGEVVGVIFPRYYALGYVCCILSITALLIAGGGVISLQLVFLAAMAGCTFYSGRVIGPRAKNLKEEIKSQDNPEQKDALKSRFDKIHTLSVRLNGAVLALGLGVLWLTAGGMKL